MRLRPLNTLLLVATVVGAFLAFTSAQKVAAMRAEYNRISRIAGDLQIEDPTRVHIMALKTDDPWYFAWRVYVPAKFALPVRWSAGASSNGTRLFDSEPREFIARFRLIADSDNGLSYYESFGPSRSFSTVGFGSPYAYVLAHRDELVIEQLGVGETVTLGSDDTATLLKISLPTRLGEEARKKFGTSQPLFPSLSRRQAAQSITHRQTIGNSDFPRRSV